MAGMATELQLVCQSKALAETSALTVLLLRVVEELDAASSVMSVGDAG
jgi:hypothetical protein